MENKIQELTEKIYAEGVEKGNAIPCAITNFALLKVINMYIYGK